MKRLLTVLALVIVSSCTVAGKNVPKCVELCSNFGGVKRIEPIINADVCHCIDGITKAFQP